MSATLEKVDRTVSRARVHTVYLYLLEDCLRLNEDDAKELNKRFNLSSDECFELGIRSMPSRVARIVFMAELAKMFDYDLKFIPGFYYDYEKELTVAWQINLPCTDKQTHPLRPMKTFGFLKPYRDGQGLISGFFIYKSIKDSRPRLLTSKGLCLGSEASTPQETEMRLLAA